MPMKRPSGSRSEVIRCPNCGEDYSVTYKRCPFCDERATMEVEYYDEPYDEEDEYLEGEDDEMRPPRSGGKRLAAVKKQKATTRRGGGYGEGGGILRTLVTILSLAIIVAAVWIVATQIAPMVGRGKVDPTPTPVATAPVSTPSAVLPTPEVPDVDDAGNVIVPPAVTDTPAVPTPSPSAQVSGGQTATGFTMSGNGDFTLAAGQTYTFKITYTPAGSKGGVSYSVDKPGVISVDANGKVTQLAKGTATVTATLTGTNVTQKCIVRAAGPVGGGAVEPGTSQAPSSSGSSLTQNKKDVTLVEAGQSFRMKISGTSSPITWASTNTSIATVAGDGTVTAVGKGTCNITAKVDGQTFTCIVRCKW